MNIYDMKVLIKTIRITQNNLCYYTDTIVSIKLTEEVHKYLYNFAVIHKDVWNHELRKLIPTKNYNFWIKELVKDKDQKTFLRIVINDEISMPAIITLKNDIMNDIGNIMGEVKRFKIISSFVGEEDGN